jgi:diaminopimelate decarboxylase
LRFAGVSATELVDTYDTPLYLLDDAEFQHQALMYRDAFDGYTVYYASKALLNRTVVRWVAKAGLGLDVCSGNELRLALEAEFDPARITLHGNNKSLDELVLACESGVGRIVVDCMDELLRIEKLISDGLSAPKLLLRVKTGVQAHTHEYIATAHEDQKFGFSLSSGAALEALQWARSKGLPLVGIHSHIGSQILKVSGFITAARRLLELLAEYRDTTGEQLPVLCLGGGFGIVYTPADTPLPPHDLAAALRAVLPNDCARLGLELPQLAIEPGRAIVGPCGVALYRVGVVKQVELESGGSRTYVAVDGGMSDNPRPALYGADYSCALANRASDAEPVLARVVGKHCESGDILVRDCYLPADVRPDDIIAIAAVGAYCRSLSSNYNMALRPPLVALRTGTARLIVRRETFADLMATDVG